MAVLDMMPTLEEIDEALKEMAFKKRLLNNMRKWQLEHGANRVSIPADPVKQTNLLGEPPATAYHVPAALKVPPAFDAQVASPEDDEDDFGEDDIVGIPEGVDDEPPDDVDDEPEPVPQPQPRRRVTARGAV